MTWKKPTTWTTPVDPAVKRAPKKILWIFLAIAALLGAGAFVLTQPTLQVTLRSNGRSFDWRPLSRHVYAISDVLSPRSWEHDNLNLVADYIAEEWRLSGITAEEQNFETGDGEFKNVLSAYGPDTNDVIVVGAHYDAAGGSPGADDNASGVAGLIELGKALAKAPLKTRVFLAAFALEEPPHFGTEEMGSLAFARALKASNKNVKAMISLEMIGYYSVAPGSQEYPFGFLRLFYPNRGNFLAVVGNLGNIPLTRKVKTSFQSVSDLPVYSINAPPLLEGVDYSDHRNFWHEGFPAVMLTDTAFYRNKAYHTAGDKPERLDYKRMAEAMKGVHEAVIELANE